MHASCQHEVVLLGLVIEHEVVIVSVAQDELLVVLIDSGADPRRRREIQGRTLHGTKFTRGNQVLIHGRELVGIDHDLVIQNVAVPGALQIEVAVLAHIDGSRFVGLGFIVNDECIPIGQGVGDRNLEIARKPFLAVLAEIAKCDAVPALQRFAVPHNLVESSGHAAM